MSEDRCLLEQTFALTSQKFEGTIALLDVSVDLRKIPAKLVEETDGRVVIETTRRYAQSRILHDHDIAELEGSDDDRSSGEGAVGSSIRVIPTEAVDLADSDDGEEETELIRKNDEEDEDEEVDSEATEENPHLAAEENPSDNSQDRAWPDSPPPSPPPYSPEGTSSRRRRSPLDQRGEIRSPSPPGYMPSFYLQNLYSPPILLRSEEEYRHHRRELVRQHKRDCLDLYYKYEFYSQQLKRARRQYY
jgi:hypothetical protein